ncbi:MAG TPA: hypothetical protein VF889_06490 [Bacteroidota bacterium]
MMRRPTLLLLVLLSVLSDGWSQSQNTTVARTFEFLPAGTLFPPLAANADEPRIGIRKELASTRMKLDMGGTLDFLQYTFDDSASARLSLGAEIFALGLTTSAQGFRLQVDAIDGFYGGHVLFRLDDGPRVLAARLRLLHHSAHLVDGHWSNASGSWLNGRLPVATTQDFGELAGAFTVRVAGMPLRIYSGIAYATLVRPGDIQRVSSLHGLELNTGERLGAAFGKPCEAYAAYNLTLTGVPAYVGTNVLEGGVKFGLWDGTGIKLYVNYVAGLEFFGQYFNERQDGWGAGFTLDLW